MAYAGGMKYDEFWNATIAEAVACVDGYLKRQEDYLRGVRKICWHVLLPWIEKAHRGYEWDLFPLPGDPTKEEIDAMRNGENKSIVDELKKAKEQLNNAGRKHTNTD